MVDPSEQLTNDAELIRAASAGNRTAASTFYKRYLPAVWRYVHLRIADRQAVEDIVGETFLAAFRHINAFHPKRGTAYRWLLGIARNKLTDHLRQTSRTKVSTLSLADEPVDTREPDRALLAAETETAVLLALDGLSDEERLVLEWKYVEGLSVREIARRLARTPKAIEALLYRARGAFRKRYDHQQTE